MCGYVVSPPEEVTPLEFNTHTYPFKNFYLYEQFLVLDLYYSF